MHQQIMHSTMGTVSLWQIWQKFQRSDNIEVSTELHRYSQSLAVKAETYRDCQKSLCCQY